MARFAGKRVLVTAAAVGLGRATAAAFRDAGARVFICDIDGTGLSELGSLWPDVLQSHTDVSQPEAVDRLFDQVDAELGGLDILVNNAGVAGPTAPLESVSFEAWRSTLAVNLDSQFLCARRAIPLLKQARGGSIVNLSSTAGFLGYPLRSPYVASKWAVIGLSKTLASELGPFGIRVNAICPGALEGERMDRVIAAEAAARGMLEADVRRAYERQTSLGTFIAPGDVAEMILFVCSEAGAKVSGQALAVDGHTESLSV